MRACSPPLVGAPVGGAHGPEGSARLLLLLLHGDSGNLKKWFVKLEAFRQANFDVVMLDYRGFGKSTGQIRSEQQLHADVEAVWPRVGPMYEGKRVVISGNPSAPGSQSLGTGLAAGLAAQLSARGRAPDLTLLVSPYSSMRALAAETYPWVPKGVLRYPLKTLEYAAQLLGPVMLIHGEKDELIGIHHSEQLQKSMRSAQLLRVTGAGHGDVHQSGMAQKALMLALGRL